jgi:hypothetical protein
MSSTGATWYQIAVVLLKGRQTEASIYWLCMRGDAEGLKTTKQQTRRRGSGATASHAHAGSIAGQGSGVGRAPSCRHRLRCRVGSANARVALPMPPAPRACPSHLCLQWSAQVSRAIRPSQRRKACVARAVQTCSAGTANHRRHTCVLPLAIAIACIAELLACHMEGTRPIVVSSVQHVLQATIASAPCALSFQMLEEGLPDASLLVFCCWQLQVRIQSYNKCCNLCWLLKRTMSVAHAQGQGYRYIWQQEWTSR